MKCGPKAGTMERETKGGCAMMKKLLALAAAALLLLAAGCNNNPAEPEPKPCLLYTSPSPRDCS